MIIGFMQVVSQSDAQGTVKVVSSLADVQGQNFDSQTVLIAEKVGGNEDIPVSLEGSNLSLILIFRLHQRNSSSPS